MMSIAATRIYRSNKLLKIYRYVGDDLFFFHITLTVINVIEVQA
jgi:hypothetical protein